MGRWRFSIAGMMAVVVLLALGLAALRSPSSLSAGIAFLSVGAILLAAILGAVYHRGRRQAFWLGFALFGWSYFVLSLLPLDRNEVSPFLPTTRLLDEVHRRVRPFPESVNPLTKVYFEDTGDLENINQKEWFVLEWIYFRRLGQYLLALLAACLGGITGIVFHATRGQRGDSGQRR